MVPDTYYSLQENFHQESSFRLPIKENLFSLELTQFLSNAVNVIVRIELKNLCLYTGGCWF